MKLYTYNVLHKYTRVMQYSTMPVFSHFSHFFVINIRFFAVMLCACVYVKIL